MNTGQMMLAMGAMILLSTLVMRVNNTLFSTNEVMLESKFGVLANSLATSIIEEASNKAFDHETDTTAFYNKDLLTAPGDLGSEGENYTEFNDFDDFNGYTRVVDNLPSAVFDISCKVHYVNPPDLETEASTRTWHKKIIVTVASESSKDTVRLSSVYSYWFF